MAWGRDIGWPYFYNLLVGPSYIPSPRPPYPFLVAPAAKNPLCLGACMGVEGSWYLISYNQDPTTPHGPQRLESFMLGVPSRQRSNLLCVGGKGVGPAAGITLA